MKPKKRKKSFIVYGNRYATCMVLTPYLNTNINYISIPMLIDKPHAACIKKVRITIEEV